MSKPLINIVGNLGAGKTTLVRRVHERFGWWIGQESVDDNPYLPAFYADRSRWAFHLQVHFLGHRARVLAEAALHPEGAVVDASIFADRDVYARVLLNPQDYATYKAVHEMIVPTLPTPDTIVFVTAPVHILLQRIQQRGQPFDRGISADYLQDIDRRYREWVATLDQARVMEVDSTAVNFTAPLSDPGIARVLDRIHDMLE